MDPIDRKEYRATIKVILEDLHYIMHTPVDEWELTDEEKSEGQELMKRLLSLYTQLERELTGEPSAFDEARADYESTENAAISRQLN